jgi:hypothetical protein
MTGEEAYRLYQLALRTESNCGTDEWSELDEQTLLVAEAT